MTKMTEGKKHKEKTPTEDSVPHDDTVGEALRAARAAKGKTIEDVAAALRIRHTQLRAIEENNIGALPGITYAVGFVRSYANYLGLNGAEMVNRFKTQHGFSPAQSKLDFPEPVAESRMPDPLIIGVGAFLAILVLAIWTFYASMESADVHQAEQIQPAPVEAAAPAPQPAAASVADATAATAPVAATASTDATAAAAPATAPAPDATATAGAPAPVAATTAATTTPVTVHAAAPAAVPAPDATAAAAPAVAPAAAPAPEAVPQQTADAAAAPAAAEPAKEEKKAEAKKKDKDGVIEVKRGKSRITLRANQSSWIEVSNNDGDVVFKKVLHPGESYMVPDQPGMSLVTSNAGGLDITVDGAKVQSIGTQGEIVRGVSLEAASLKKKRTKAY